MRSKLKLGIGILIIIGILIVVYIVRTSQQPESKQVVEVEVPQQVIIETVIGQSVEGRDITQTTIGDGPTKLLFVGGVHGGYEWNSVVLAYEMIEHLSLPDLVPDSLSVSVIPNLNPDGVFAVTGLTGEFTASDVTATVEETIPGRFNARSVDLNRNFDCKWQPESTWRGNTVSAGTSAFSEPEAVALRDHVAAFQPAAVVFWHSQANNVYASECENGVIPETLDIMNAYANAAGYGAVASFDAYPVTGDAEGWLASIGIPAITVELKTHETVEFEQNKAGVTALFDYYTTRE